MKENKVKKINIVDENELKDVAGGRAYNEEWVCPKCGYVIYLTHYNANFGVQEHMEKHGFICYGADYGENYNRKLILFLISFKKNSPIRQTGNDLSVFVFRGLDCFAHCIDFAIC